MVKEKLQLFLTRGKKSNFIGLNFAIMKWKTLGRNHSCSQGPSAAAAASERPQKSPEELREKLRMVFALSEAAEHLGVTQNELQHLQP